MTETLAVVVVVVTHNSATHVDALLDSLPRALFGLSYSVVIVDNGSHDATVDHVSRRTDCRLVESVNDGFAAGVNRGVKSSLPSRTLLVLNPDATLDAGSGRAMLAVLERRGAGVVVPRIRSSDGELFPSLRRAPTLLRVGGLSFTGLALFAERIDAPASYTHEHVVDWATGAVMLIDRTCYEELGGLDESYFLYSEETDFASGKRRRMANRIHARCGSHARRWWLWPQRPHPHDADDQQGPAVPPEGGRHAGGTIWWDRCSWNCGEPSSGVVRHWLPSARSSFRPHARTSSRRVST